MKLLQAEQGDGSYHEGGKGTYGKRESGKGTKNKNSNGEVRKESKLKNAPRGLYDMLGIMAGSDRSAVRKAYHELAQKVPKP